MSGVPSLPAVPNTTKCLENNWYISEPDLCAPPKPWPVPGQLVYIRDPLQETYYNKGLWPTIVQAEGYITSFCVGDYLPPGARPMPPNGIRAAHVVKNFVGPQHYWQVHGYLDCVALKVNCTQSFPGAYDDGGQFDSVPFENCGKSPYSGPDSTQHPGFPSYNEQAGMFLFIVGNGIYCMRICQGGTQLTDPCNVKNDTAGCTATMGVQFYDGFSFEDKSTGQIQNLSVSLPPPQTQTDLPANPTGGSGSSQVNTSGGSGSTATAQNSGALRVDVLFGFVIILLSLMK